MFYSAPVREASAAGLVCGCVPRALMAMVFITNSGSEIERTPQEESWTETGCEEAMRHCSYALLGQEVLAHIRLC